MLLLSDAATAADFNPLSPRHFLAGYADGAVRLFRAGRGAPLVQWPRACGGEGVVQLLWCPDRPSAFFVLDASGSVHTWDLLASDAGALTSEPLAASTLAIGAGGLLLGLRSSELRLYALQPRFATASGDELQRTQQWLERAGL